MGDIDTGGFAFPCDSGANQFPTQEGMTLRDYFAAKALSSMEYELFQDANWQMDIAKGAYQIADAMIELRNGGES